MHLFRRLSRLVSFAYRGWAFAIKVCAAATIGLCLIILLLNLVEAVSNHHLRVFLGSLLYSKVSMEKAFFVLIGVSFARLVVEKIKKWAQSRFVQRTPMNPARPIIRAEVPVQHQARVKPRQQGLIRAMVPLTLRARSASFDPSQN